MSITAYTHGGSQGRSTSQWRSYDLVYKASVADLRMCKFDPVKMADITTLVQHHHAGALCSARVSWTMSLTVHTH